MELEKNAPEIVGNDVDLIYDYKKLPLDCRNFKVIPHKKNNGKKYMQYIKYGQDLFLFKQELFIGRMKMKSFV